MGGDEGGGCDGGVGIIMKGFLKGGVTVLRVFIGAEVEVKM